MLKSPSTVPWDKVSRCPFPFDSQLISKTRSAYYCDTYKTIISDKLINVLEIYKCMVNNTPAWINGLLAARNKIMLLFGIRDVGLLGNVDNKQESNNNLPGQKLDIFRIESINPQEMILVLDDKHLNIRLSILKIENDDYADIYISTLITDPNCLGKMYMTLITPFHRVIVKRLMRNLNGVRS